ncbi:MAG: glycoside hydrolase family 5 protein [Candidatus Krumholzibacteriia bacterium]
MRRIVVLSILAFLLVGTHRGAALDKLEYWSEPRRGANWFNEVPTREWLEAARAAGIAVVRLAPNKWATEERDFLIGDADQYDGLVERDLEMLLEVLDQAHAAGVGVVLTTLSLPGARWRQHNEMRLDPRLWRDPGFLPQAAALWRDLAARLAGHPAVVGYNILNEPVPERATGFDGWEPRDLLEWYSRVEGTPADLNRFNASVVQAIREVDPDTPIVLDSGSWGSPAAIAYLRPLADERVLYSFHMYEPFVYTNKKANGGRFDYPGKIVSEAGGGRARLEIDLNANTLEAILRPVVEWQERHEVPANRVFAGEFGCHRTTGGAGRYLEDVIEIFDAHGWHWAFYSFREDTWDGMDYELGAKPLGWAYWRAKERGEAPGVKRFANPVWAVLERGLR